MSTKDKETIMPSMERVEAVRFIMLVMRTSYRTYVIPYIILYYDFIHDIVLNR